MFLSRSRTPPALARYVSVCLDGQDLGVDVVGSIVAGSQGQRRDEAGVQGGGRGLQFPAGEARAHLEHPRRTQQQLAPGGPQGFRGRVTGAAGRQTRNARVRSLEAARRVRERTQLVGRSTVTSVALALKRHPCLSRCWALLC